MNRGLLVATAILLAASVAHAADLAVGPGKTFGRIEDALAKAQAGDTILVYPLAGGAAYEKVALYVDKARITFKAVPAKPGERVALSGKGFDYSGVGRVPRAMVQFNPEAVGCMLEGFELFGAHNDSHNGSGVRINQADKITVRGCSIHNNDMGIMSNGDGTPKTAAQQDIDACIIYSNGDPSDPGYNHNLYLGGTSVYVTGCEIHSSLTGHNVKSRAHTTWVEGCYIHDSANREFDLVDAKGDTTTPDSNATIVGCIIVKDPKCKGNKAVIHFGQDGGNGHTGKLAMWHNTIVTPFISPVVTLDAAGAGVNFVNNIIWDAGSGQRGQVLLEPGKTPKDGITGSHNWLSAGFADSLKALGLTNTFLAEPGHAPPFVNPAKGDYHLAKADPSIVNAGIELPRGTFVFTPPLGHVAREGSCKTLGAFEFVPAGR